MPSFSAIFSVVSLACAAFAAPLVDVGAKAAVGVAVPPLAKVGAAVDAGIHVRHDQYEVEKTVPSILTDVTAKVTVAIAPLTFITKANATVETITPVVDEVKVILSGAIVDVKAVVGAAGGLVGGLLTLVGQVLSVVDLAGLIHGLLAVIFVALGAVLKVVAVADKAVITPLLVDVAKLVAELLKIVLPIVGGLLAALLPLVGDVLVVVDALGVTDIFAAIGLKL